MKNSIKKSTFIALTLLFIASPAMAQLEVFPRWLNFGQVDIRDHLGQRDGFWIRNNSQQAVNIRVRDTFCWQNFEVQDYSCQHLVPNQQCHVTVVFRPRTVGYHSCDLEIEDWRNGAPSERVSVAGWGISRR